MKVDELIQNEVSRIAEPTNLPKLKKISGFVKDPNAEKSPFQKFLGIFLTDDLPGVRKHLLTDYVYPAAKDFVAGILFETIQRMFYGNGKSTSTTNYSNVSSSLVRTNTSKTNYANPSTLVTSVQTTPQQSQKISWDNIVMKTHSQATQLVAELRDAIRRYDKVSVLQLYDSLEETDSLDVSDQYLGWTNLDSVPIVPFNGGFKVCLPKPEELR